jgi:hypothetical protein
MKRLIALLFAAAAGCAAAASPADYQNSLLAEARRSDAGFAGFSAARGERFYRASHGGDWTCATCHTNNPAATGSHTVTGKPVKPLAPAANPERFSDADKIEKWFKRNCNDVLKRPCTALEKGDLLAWLLTVKP